MKSQVLRTMSVGAGAVALGASLFVAAPSASAGYTTCGTHTHKDVSRSGSTVYVKVRIHHRNCNMYKSARLRPDVANAWDPSCKTVAAGGTGYWSFSYSYYDGFAGGVPYYRKMYYC